MYNTQSCLWHSHTPFFFIWIGYDSNKLYSQLQWHKNQLCHGNKLFINFVFRIECSTSYVRSSADHRRAYITALTIDIGVYRPHLILHYWERGWNVCCFYGYIWYMYMYLHAYSLAGELEGGCGRESWY